MCYPTKQSNRFKLLINLKFYQRFQEIQRMHKFRITYNTNTPMTKGIRYENYEILKHLAYINFGKFIPKQS